MLSDWKSVEKWVMRKNQPSKLQNTLSNDSLRKTQKKYSWTENKQGWLQVRKIRTDYKRQTWKFRCTSYGKRFYKLNPCTKLVQSRTLLFRPNLNNNSSTAKKVTAKKKLCLWITFAFYHRGCMGYSSWLSLGCKINKSKKASRVCWAVITNATIPILISMPAEISHKINELSSKKVRSNPFLVSLWL